MSIFGKIFSKIFPSSQAVQAPASIGANPAGIDAASINPAATATMAGAASMQQVDVETVLDDMARKNSDTLNWRTSIVDLMKLLGLDNSLSERKDLAKELSYSGDTNDSASMNIWLHKQVMNKLAANGGKVPADLKD